MQSLGDLFDAFYTRFVLRDLLGKIGPGLLVLFALGTALTSPTILVDTAKTLPFWPWVAVLTVAWLAGWAMQIIPFFSSDPDPNELWACQSVQTLLNNQRTFFRSLGADPRCLSPHQLMVVIQVYFYGHSGKHEQRLFERSLAMADMTTNTFKALSFALVTVLAESIILATQSSWGHFGSGIASLSEVPFLVNLVISAFWTHLESGLLAAFMMVVVIWVFWLLHLTTTTHTDQLVKPYDYAATVALCWETRLRKTGCSS